MSIEKILIYCDGACSGNQFDTNVGGWGAILRHGDRVKKIFGGEKNTTSQRMELTACIKALEEIKSKDIDVEIYSDSAYLVNCINDKWYEKWRSNGWRNSKEQPVENKDLWQRLLSLVEQYNVSFHKVNAHSGVYLNEVANELAQRGIRTSS